MTQLRFKDLSEGEVFRFESEAIYLSMASGPWCKLSARTYEHCESSLYGTLRVGSISAKVTRA